MRISDWSSDVCSSDLHDHAFVVVDVGSGDGSARADVAHHETAFVIDDAVGGVWALLGFAAVGDDHGFELLDRKRVVSGQSVSVHVDLGGPRPIHKQQRNIISTPAHVM